MPDYLRLGHKLPPIDKPREPFNEEAWADFVREHSEFVTNEFNRGSRSIRFEGSSARIILYQIEQDLRTDRSDTVQTETQLAEKSTSWSVRETVSNAIHWFSKSVTSMLARPSAPSSSFDSSSSGDSSDISDPFSDIAPMHHSGGSAESPPESKDCGESKTVTASSIDAVTNPSESEAVWDQAHESDPFSSGF